MVNKNKVKGSKWEHDLVEILKKQVGGDWKRVPTSGAIGTLLNEPLLCGDISGSVPGINKKFRIEAKVGYGGETQLTVKKDWFDKIKSEAENVNSYPLVACKFSGARSGVKYFIAMDIDTLSALLDEYNTMYDELSRLYEQEHKK